MLEPDTDSRPSADDAMNESKAHPNDAQLRERAARALVAEKRYSEAIAILQLGFKHFNAHDTGTLPCLCKTCINPEDVSVTVQGTTFTQDFTVAKGRVLFFWVPNDLLAQKKRINRSVHAGLRTRLD